MGRMLSNACRKDRQGRQWWYCCPGHDGVWKIFLAENKSAQRSREKKAWRREEW